jgi:hypothetical protein
VRQERVRVECRPVVDIASNGETPVDSRMLFAFLCKIVVDEMDNVTPRRDRDVSKG